MGNVLLANAVVIRFAPNSANGLMKSASNAGRHSGHFRVSVFASTRLHNESEDSVIDRLLTASELGGISALSNTKYFLCSTAEDVEALGYAFVKDGYDGEIPEHYSIDFGREPSLEDAQKLSDTFTKRKRIP